MNLRKLLLFTLFSIVLTACNWFKEKPEIAKVLSSHFNNKLYNKFDTAAYKPVFKEALAKHINASLNPKVIEAYYQSNEYLPLLVTKFYVNGGLDSLKRYVLSSYEDGFNPEIFLSSALEKDLAILNANKFKNIDEVYAAVADLEISSALALNKYTNFMRFGAINPANFLNRYYIKNLRPDSAKMDSVLNAADIVAELKKSQPAAPAYLALKKGLAVYRDSLKNEENEAIKTIKINLERMRWQLPVNTSEAVWVNIPDFRLTWIKGTDTLASMKVCVGEKREAGYADKMKAYLKSGKLDDKPKNHETPQLVSVFNSIQVNPIWNIPASIAKSEIYWMAMKNPAYLSNNNIKVYQNGRLIDEPDTIQWDKYPREKLPFSFKQGSGDGNALGKFKFVFDNSSSIYLHDTNAKYGFNLSKRAISHGCIRVEDPLKFAQLLVNNDKEYDKLRMEVDLPPVDTAKNELFKTKMAKKTDTLNTFQLKPTWFATRKGVAVVVSYFTAWANNNKIEFRPDVYGYDPILWEALKRYM